MTQQLQPGLARDSHGHMVMMLPVCEQGQQGEIPKLDDALAAITAIYRKKREDPADNQADKKDGEEKKEDDGEDFNKAKRKKREDNL